MSESTRLPRLPNRRVRTDIDVPFTITRPRRARASATSRNERWSTLHTSTTTSSTPFPSPFPPLFFSLRLSHPPTPPALVPAFTASFHFSKASTPFPPRARPSEAARFWQIRSARSSFPSRALARTCDHARRVGDDAVEIVLLLAQPKPSPDPLAQRVADEQHQPVGERTLERHRADGPLGCRTKASDAAARRKAVEKKADPGRRGDRAMHDNRVGNSSGVSETRVPSDCLRSDEGSRDAAERTRAASDGAPPTATRRLVTAEPRWTAVAGRADGAAAARGILRALQAAKNRNKKD